MQWFGSTFSAVALNDAAAAGFNRCWLSLATITTKDETQTESPIPGGICGADNTASNISI